MTYGQEPLWYTCQHDGGNSAFGYIVWEGKTYAGVVELVFQNGAWIDPSGIFCSIQVVPFGDGGSQVQVDSQAPTSMSPDNLLSLAFRGAVDLTKPLPLDQFSAADSSLQIFVAGRLMGTSKVISLTATSPPPA